MKKIIIKVYLWFFQIYSDCKFYLLTLFKNYPKVHSDKDTLELLINSNNSLARFGDGEFSIIQGRVLRFQNKNDRLADKLVETLFTEKENLLIGIPRISRAEYLNKLTLESKRFWRADFVKNQDIWRRLSLEKEYYDASVTRPYIRYNDKNHSSEVFELWKKLWNGKEILIVEGEKTRLGINNELFCNSRSISRIICPSEDAFNSYDKIVNSIVKNHMDKLILIALGPTATVLVSDLVSLGIRSIDVGHIDIEYDWFCLGSKKRINIEGKYVNEVANGNNTNDIENIEYQSQIIDRIIKE